MITIEDIGNKNNLFKLPNGLEGYKKDGFWIYRNSNPKAGSFARMWTRQTDLKINKEWDKRM